MKKRTLSSSNDRLWFAAEFPLLAYDIVKPLTDFDFLIALTATRDPRYRELFKRERDPNRYRIVDSGIFEDPTNPLPPVRHLSVAMDLEADEVVPTDIINDCAGTLRMMDEFLALASEFPFKIQGVVQGSSLKEWLLCFWKLHDNPRVDVIGLTYFEVPADLKSIGLTDFGVPDKGEAARLTLLSLVVGGIGVKQPDSPLDDLEFTYKGPVVKPIHLLGCRDCRALKHYICHPLVRSIDTSFPVQLGVEGRPLTLKSEKSAFKVNFGADIIRAERCLIASNTLRFLQLCRGEDPSSRWEFVDRFSQLV